MKRIFILLLLFPFLLHAQIITTVVGTGVAGSAGDGGSCKSAQLCAPNSLVFDKAGNMYITDAGNNKIRKVSSGGIISTYAGNGSRIYSGDGGPAISAGLTGPEGIAIDTADNIYVSTYEDGRIRKISKVGIITTIAGNGTIGFNGDNIPATTAQLYGPYMGFADNAGNVYFTDRGNKRVRKINAAGIISTIAGDGTDVHGGDGGPATAATLKQPSFTSISPSGDIYIPENYGYCIRRIDHSGTITTFAGTGVIGNDGDGGPATNARFTMPNYVAFDSAGNTYIADFQAGVVRKINSAGIISTVAGSGVVGYGGDGLAATLAKIALNAVAIDKYGDLFIVDYSNNRIRKVHSTVGIREVGNKIMEILVFPNPAVKELFITASSAIDKVHIMNALGQIVYNGDYHAQQIAIDVSGLPAGVYMLEVISGGNSVVKKVVKE